MTRRPQMIHEYWWTCFPALPPGRGSLQYRRIMRLYADHTLNGLNGQTGRSVYRHGGEDHLVLSFFENFIVDQAHEWVAFIAERLNMGSVPILAANWSYAFEEKLSGETRPRIADIVLQWQDQLGKAVVVIEAKRPGGVPKSGLNDKDDPRSGYYLKYSALRSIARKQQILLIGRRDREKLGLDLRDDPRILTWEELADTQLAIFKRLAPSPLSTTVEARLVAHHHELGLTHDRANSTEAQFAIDWAHPNIGPILASWLRGTESYFAARNGESVLKFPFDWLGGEQGREALLSAKHQSTRDREIPLWQLPL